ncbi:PQQ-binding-like beta-propeller repeat protein [Roseomonas sp. OT10]|uniref:outer membrane protein assembly factor BamB family protein n=1 Tax=Roseomonas cutis TaxID=2897332 RepID=UPI001E31CEE5|nr:PQQ-binding-like beta-propeller repeat protein [Roseomonas sp. OT10]UFN47055.1 PQQ-binding-like beta-propeller repeat protein [Roseomonas sp. OT10]
MTIRRDLSRHPLVAGRRMALLGAMGLLAGCETLEDLLSDKPPPLPGERRSVIDGARSVSPDPAVASRPVSLPAPAPIASWPQSGGSLDHSPGMADLPAESLRQAWRSSVGAGSAYRQRMTAGPVASADTVYAADAFGEVSAFDLARGGRRWRLDTSPKDDDVGAVGAGAALEGDTLYLATGLAEVLAVNPADGTVRWRVRTPAPTRGAPTVANGRIFVVTLENHLIALSTEDGRRLWTYRAQPVTAVPLGLPSPAVEGEMVVAGFPSGDLVCLRPSDGRVLWTEALSALPSERRGGIADLLGVTAAPVISDGRVITVGRGGTTMAVDLRSGRRLWEREVGGTVTPAVAGDWIFLVSYDQELVAISRDSGQVRWVTALNAPPPPGSRRREPASFAAPVLTGGRIIVPGTGSEALVVDPADGAVVARLPLPGPVSLPAAIAGGALLVLADDGNLAALRA